MRFRKVESLLKLEDASDYYSLGIFSSGFERRSTHLIKSCGPDMFKRVMVFKFALGGGALSRPENDGYFESIPKAEFLQLEGNNDDELIFTYLENFVVECYDSVLRIFVDYSSMTRSWYGAILTWARLCEKSYSIEIDFVYASGRYLSEFDPLLISEIETLPNFEGISGGFRKTSALFGLGYDQYATLAVYDRIEPDSLYCCVASLSPNDPSALKTIHANQAMIEAAERLVELPLLNIESAFRDLCDLLMSIGRDSHVVVVPMGPKTHVLVTLLVAIRMPWLTCLHAKGFRPQPVQVEATGPLSIARIYFSPD